MAINMEKHIKQMLGRYKASKNPAKRALGLHDSMKLSPAMAKKTSVKRLKKSH